LVAVIFVRLVLDDVIEGLKEIAAAGEQT